MSVGWEVFLGLEKISGIGGFVGLLDPWDLSDWWDWTNLVLSVFGHLHVNNKKIYFLINLTKSLKNVLHRF